jgi:hypothetical protein
MRGVQAYCLECPAQAGARLPAKGDLTMLARIAKLAGLR